MEMHTIPNDYFFSIVEDELARGKNVEFTVKGYSMLPYIRNMKDSVVLYPCNKEELKPLDFVLFRFHGRHILHRIIKIEDNHYTLQGDGIYASQEYCTGEDIVGIVRYIVRNGRKVSVDDKNYQRYIKIWYRLRFMRRYLLFGCRVLSRLFEV